MAAFFFFFGMGVSMGHCAGCGFFFFLAVTSA